MHSHRSRVPSSWITRYAGLIAEGGHVLDLACGGGRHTRYLRDCGLEVTAMDIDTSGLADLADDPLVEIVEMDLERPGTTPLAGRRFNAVVVTDYLFRPLLVPLVDCLLPGGVFLYETFALGNERHGRPRNPDFLLQRGELLALAEGRLSIVAYEHLAVPPPNPRIVQHLCARKPARGP